MATAFTLAGESLVAQKQGAQEALRVARFVLAHVPDLNTALPVDRETGLPPADQIVYDAPVSHSGYLDQNQVIYSLAMDSSVGNFAFNWLGLVTEEEVLLAVAYVPLQHKRRDEPPLHTGNNLTRNMVVVFDGAQSLTEVTIPAESWQYDLTGKIGDIYARLEALAGLKLDKAVLEEVPVGEILVRGPGTTMTGLPAAELVLSTEPASEDFTAKAGGRYWIGADLIATLPTTVDQWPGAAVAFIKALDAQVQIRSQVGDPPILTRAGLTPEVAFDVDAEVIFSFNGTHWEV